MYNFVEMYDILEGCVGVSESALALAFAIGGRSKETAEAILFYYTGWHFFEGYMEEYNEMYE